MATETTGNTSAAPLSKWAIPGLLPEDLVQIQAQPGRITSVVGANGAGKSALGIWMTQNSAAIRLSAHRRLWFRSAGPEISTMEREDAISNGRYYASQPDARYVDHEANQRTSIVLFDLLVKLNAENAALADLVMNGADRAALDTLQRREYWID
jgi:ribose 1,5-bisphosphokinase PhnN